MKWLILLLVILWSLLMFEIGLHHGLETLHEQLAPFQPTVTVEST